MCDTRHPTHTAPEAANGTHKIAERQGAHIVGLWQSSQGDTQLFLCRGSCSEPASRFVAPCGAGTWPMSVKCGISVLRLSAAEKRKAGAAIAGLSLEIPPEALE